MAKSKVKKPTETLWYSCIRRYYNIKNEDEQKQEQKKMWIVIGDGHKWYRKFETQAEAIRYFRKLKKYAKMRVQSVNSHEFVKIVSTLLELERQGVEVKKIKQTNFKNNYKKWDDSKNFDDEFSKFEFDKVNENDQSIQDEIDKVIQQKEGDYFIGKTTEIKLPMAIVEEEEEEEEDEDLIYVRTSRIKTLEDVENDEKQKELNQQQQIEREVPSNTDLIECGGYQLDSEIITPEEEAWISNNQFVQLPPSYSKLNPIVIKAVENKKASKVYSFFKILFVISMIVFAVFALWCSFEWKSDSLNRLGVDFTNHFSKLADGNYDITNPIYLAINSAEWDSAAKLGIYQWSNSMMNEAIFSLIGIFSIIGIFASITTLIFKNGTLFSLLSFIIVVASLVIVVTIVILGLVQVNEVVSLYNSISPKTPTNEMLIIIRQIKQMILGANALA